MLRVRLFGGVAGDLDGRALQPPRSRRAWAPPAGPALHPGEHERGEMARP